MTKKIDFDPNELSKRAMDLLSANQFVESKKIFLKLSNFFPYNIDLINFIAYINLKLDLNDEAIDFYTKSLSIDKNQIGALFNRALLYNKNGNTKKAIEDYEKILILDPKNSDAVLNIVDILENLQEFNKAIDIINRALKFNESDYRLFATRANLFQTTYNYSIAIEDYKKALKISKNNIDILQNYGNALKHFGDSKGAVRLFEDALAKDPQNPSIQKNLGILLLQQKDFLKGWKYFDYSFKNGSTENFPLDFDNIPYSANILTDKKILLWGNSGVGDQILFSSTLNELKNVKEITIAIDDRLVKIYERSFKSYKFIGFSKLKNSNISLIYDAQLPLCLLVRYHRNFPSAFKNQTKSFLIPNQAKVKKYNHMIKRGSNKICGIAWRSSNKKIGHAKSLNLIDLVELLKIKNIDFYDLQYGDTSDEINELEKKFNLNLKSLPNIDKFNDFDGLLAFIEACDFIVTSSNVTAHLAGSIGKETYLLAPHSLGNLWYWHDEVKSIWYPSIKIFRQSKPNCWNDIVKIIAKNITNF